MKKIFILLLLFLLNFEVFASEYNVYSPKSYKPNNLSFCSKILFVVDFSNSMNENLGASSKVDIVLDTMSSILRFLPSQTQIGLRVYGHKNSFTQFQACRASELAVPIREDNSIAIQTKLASLKAKGSTPITYSLKQAIDFDFANISGEKRIILLTDGGENCDESPCTYAMNLIKTRDDVRIDVIAFNIFDKEADEQLKCAALVTQGKFYKVNTQAELLRSLSKSLNIKKDVQAIIIPK